MTVIMRMLPEEPLREESTPLEEANTVHPRRLLRIAAVTHEVLDEVRRGRGTGHSVDHLRALHERLVHELRAALSPDLFEELAALTPAILTGSPEEYALAHAEILGWLGGLFQGTELALELEAVRAFGEAARAHLPGAAPPPVREAPAVSSNYL